MPLVLAACGLIPLCGLAQQTTVARSVAQASAPPTASDPKILNSIPPMSVTGIERSTTDWLVRLRLASNVPSYTGTYVVWSAPGTLASSKIWRASQGAVRIERVDALTGQPRSTYRTIDHTGSKIDTFLPAQQKLRIDYSDQAGANDGFPYLADMGPGMSPAYYYEAMQKGQERVAGFLADIVQFTPRDDLRYSYRVWSDQRTGLPLKLQTIDERGAVLEQAAFSGLTFENPLSVMTLLRQKANTKGWQIEQVQRIPTTQAAEGWSIGQSLQPVPGFSLQRCYRQSDPKIIQSTAMAGMSSAYSQNRTLSDSLGKMQCVFSDGLATVSVFIEPRGAKRQSIKLQNDGLDMALGGATHLLERRIGQDGWITVVGEVPLKTLQRFAASITQVR